MFWLLKPRQTSFHSRCKNFIKIPSFNNPNTESGRSTGQFLYNGSGPKFSAPSSCPLRAGPVRSGWPQPGPVLSSLPQAPGVFTNGRDGIKDIQQPPHPRTQVCPAGLRDVPSFICRNSGVTVHKKLHIYLGGRRFVVIWTCFAVGKNADCGGKISMPRKVTSQRRKKNIDLALLEKCIDHKEK